MKFKLNIGLLLFIGIPYSIHSQDQWIRIGVDESGMYMITGEDLVSVGADIRHVDPGTFQMFSNGGKPLPEDPNLSRAEELTEVAIQIEANKGSTFKESDKIWFYGQAPEGWEYNPAIGRNQYYRNPFTQQNVYWLLWGIQPGKRIQTIDYPINADLNAITIVPEIVHIEKDLINTAHGGRQWFWCWIESESPSNLYFNWPVAYLQGEMSLDLLIRATHFLSGVLQININNRPWNGAENRRIQESGHQAILYSGRTNLQHGTNRIDFTVSNSVSLYADWIELRAYHRLTLESGPLFLVPDTTGSLLLEISGASDAIKCLDVSDYSNPRELHYTINEAEKTIKCAVRCTDHRFNQFVISSSDQARRPVSIQLVEKTNLRMDQVGADLLMISPGRFISSALAFQSFKEQTDELSVKVIDISGVFQDFGWGLPDPAALRDYLKFVYEQWSPRPRYILLLGDGHYDYRSIETPAAPNWIPPYEPDFVFSDLDGTTDDWFTYFEPSKTISFVTGRIPARTLEDLDNYFQKVQDYRLDDYRGKWQSRIIFTADDEFKDGIYKPFETEFLTATERLAQSIDFQRFDQIKVYEIMYPLIERSERFVREGATSALLSMVEQGALIWNYIGHANTQVFSDEYILNIDRDLRAINNINHPFFCYAAACQFARFDESMVQSGAEAFIFHPGGGAIAVIASTRDVYQNSNMTLLNSFYSHLFEGGNPTIRIGDALTLAKQEHIEIRENNEKFHLIGDPTLTLRLPENQCVLSIKTPQLKRNDPGKFDGSIESGSSGHPFVGQGIFELFDAPKDTVYISENQQVEYKVPGTVIYRSRFSVDNGQLSGHFFIPPLAREGHDCRISTYFWNAQTDGWGYSHNLTIEGSALTGPDTTGPEISIEIIEGYATGNQVSTHFTVRVICSDSSGIDLSGKEGILLSLIGQSTSETLDATPLFEYVQNRYKTGQFDCPFIQEQPGAYQLVCRARDNLNQMSMDSLVIEIANSQNADSQMPAEVTLLNNYPNPFNSSTLIHFYLSEPGEVSICIFNSLGQEIVRLINQYYEAGTYTVRWTGRDSVHQFASSGVYFCRLTYENQDRKIQRSQRLLLIR
jgi:hypothetical protein